MLQAIRLLCCFSNPKGFSPLGVCFFLWNCILDGVLPRRMNQLLQIAPFKIQMITDKIQMITDTLISYNCDISVSVAQKTDISAIIYK